MILKRVSASFILFSQQMMTLRAFVLLQFKQKDIGSYNKEMAVLLKLRSLGDKIEGKW